MHNAEFHAQVAKYHTDLAEQCRQSPSEAKAVSSDPNLADTKVDIKTLPVVHQTPEDAKAVGSAPDIFPLHTEHGIYHVIPHGDEHHTYFENTKDKLKGGYMQHIATSSSEHEAKSAAKLHMQKNFTVSLSDVRLSDDAELRAKNWPYKRRNN